MGAPYGGKVMAKALGGSRSAGTAAERLEDAAALGPARAGERAPTPALPGNGEGDYPSARTVMATSSSRYALR